MDAFIGEIRIFAGNYAPQYWAFCNGQLLPIAQNPALFSILGVMYGGDGRTTFALPNLNGRVPIGFGAGPGLTPRTQGQIGGSETVTLLQSEMPTHTHALGVQSTRGTSVDPSNGVLAGSSIRDRQYAPTANTTMSPQALAPTGGSQPHNNLPPVLSLSFIIALQGEFPLRG